MKKPFYIIASASVLIIALSIAYYFIIFLPSNEKAKRDLENKKLLNTIWEQTVEEEQWKEEQKSEEEKRESEQKTEEEKLNKEQVVEDETALVLKNCEKVATEKAKEAMVKKTEAFKSLGAPSQVEEFAKKGFYSKSDYNFAYEKCLRSHGIN